jgi:hypothetical protein
MWIGCKHQIMSKPINFYLYKFQFETVSYYVWHWQSLQTSVLFVSKSENKWNKMFVSACNTSLLCQSASYKTFLSV